MATDVYRSLDLFDWSGGLRNRRRNPLLNSVNTVSAGENVELDEAGVRTRGGYSVVSDESLPRWEVRYLEQVRFPSNESSYLLAQLTAPPPVFRSLQAPIARSEHTAVWDSVGGRMLVFGGLGEDCSTTLDDLWAFNPDDGSWRELTPAEDLPPGRCSHTAVFDPERNRMVVFGGTGSTGALGDLWVYDCEWDCWNQHPAGGDVPEARRRHTAILTPSGGMLVTGGLGRASVLSTEDVYTLDLESFTWSVSTASGPAPRCDHVAVWAVGGMLMFGGHNHEIQYKETWLYTGAQWISKAGFPTDHPTIGPINHAGVTAEGKVFSCFGQLYTNPDNPAWLMIYDPELNTWSAAAVEGQAPTPRGDHSCVRSDVGELIMFGGVELEDGTPKYPLTVLAETLTLSSVIFGGAGESALFASDTRLPTPQAVFTKIFDLGKGAGLVSTAVLGDRCVITEGVNHPPLVWGGAMADDGRDWMYPKQALVTMDGEHYYDISAQALDSDVDAAAQIGGVSAGGHLAVCCDMPQIEGFYVEVKTPNSTDAGSQHNVNIDLVFTQDNLYDLENFKGGVDRWVQVSGTVGALEGPPKTPIAAVINLGGSPNKVKIACPDHGLAWGHYVTIRNSGEYDGVYVLEAETTGTHLAVQHAYVPLVFGPEAEIRQRRKSPAWSGDPDIKQNQNIVTNGGQSTIKNITSGPIGEGVIELFDPLPTASVVGIHGLALSGSRLSVAQRSGPTFGASIEINSALAGAELPFPTMESFTVRQVIAAGELTASGSYVRVRLKASDLTRQVGLAFPNQGFTLSHCSIVERAGSTADGVRSPTPITFNNGAAGCSVAKGQSIVSDPIAFSLDKTKSHLLIMDVAKSPATRITVAAERTVTVSTGAYIEALSGVGQGYYIRSTACDGGEPAEESWDKRTVAGFRDLTRATVGYGSTIGLSKIEAAAGLPTPAGLYVAATNGDSAIGLGGADTFVGVTVTEQRPGASSIWYAVSLSNQQDFVIFKDSQWRPIARLNAGVWQCNTGAAGSNLWVNVVGGAKFAGLKQAMGLSQNRMTAAELNAVTPEQWEQTGGVTPGVTASTHFAFGFTADGPNAPCVNSVRVTYRDAGTTTVEGLTSRGWMGGEGWSDNTQVDGASLGQSGSIVYNGSTPFEAEYACVNGIPGFWFRFKTNGTSPDASITRIMFKAPCQPLRNIAATAATPAGLVVSKTGPAGTMRTWRPPGDDASAYASFPTPLAAATDFLYVASDLRYNGLELAPSAANTREATLTVEYWNGVVWVKLDAKDATAVNGVTLATTGRITWKAPDDWKTCVPFDVSATFGYWLRLHVDRDLSPETSLADCRVSSLPDPIAKHTFAATLGGRLALARRPDSADRLDISRPLEPYGFCGPEAFSLRTGGRDSIQCVVAAWNSLLVGNSSDWRQLKESGGGLSLDRVEAARHVPVSADAVVKAPVSGFSDGDRYGLYFINRYGAFVSTGLHVDSLWNTSRGGSVSDGVDWWDPQAIPRLDIERLGLSRGEYLPRRNWIIWAVPMILDNENTPAGSNNRLIIYDLALRAWLPPAVIGASSLCGAYNYAGQAPARLGDFGLLFGDTHGRVFRLFGPSDRSDHGRPIPCSFETGWLHFGAPDAEKTLRKLHVHGTSTAPVTVTALTERNPNPVDLMTLTNLMNPETAFTRAGGAINVSGRFIKLKFTSTDRMELFGVQIEYALSRFWSG